MTTSDTARPGVLMVTGAYFPELSGGGLQCKTMIQALGDQFRFRVFTTCTDRGLPREQVIDGTPVTRIYVDVTRPVTKIAAAWRTLVFFVRHASSFQAVHLHGFSQKSILVVLLARLFGKAVIITIHTAVHDEAEGVRRLGALAYRCYAGADRFLAISEAMAQNYRAAGLPADRLRVTPNGVDTERFRPAAPAERDRLRRELGLAADVHWIAFVGFFSRDKCPDVLFEAWRQLPSERREKTGLLFVGATESAYHEVDATLARRIRDEAAALGASHLLTFTGEVADVERVYRAADVLAMPSVREAFGMVLVEAMASGLPVVATRIPHVTDAIVDDGVTGALVPPRDAAALAAALDRLLSDRSLAATLGARARDAIIERFGLGVSAARWRAIYDEALHL